MVRILANGEIVPDDDPRVRTTTPPRSSAPRQSFLNRGHGAPLGGPGPRQQQAGARLGAAQSPFNDLNRQLVNMGFPQWHLGNHAVEPVTSILLLFLLMMLGVRGLLLVVSGLHQAQSRSNRGIPFPILFQPFCAKKKVSAWCQNVLLPPEHVLTSPGTRSRPWAKGGGRSFQTFIALFCFSGIFLLATFYL
uniref:Family with sequence similarity 241 member B n=1 Tax=Equus caballus TaxID=9796 RepID=A0A9L0RDQ7_HORSE